MLTRGPLLEWAMLVAGALLLSVMQAWAFASDASRWPRHLIAWGVSSLGLVVPFLIVPRLDWLFWGWFKSFVQYSFIPVVAIAFLMIFEQFVFRHVTTLPPTITSAEYGVYGLQAVAVIATFCVGIMLVPSLTNSIFTGTSGQSAFSGMVAAARGLRGR